jgi:putative hemolysin
VSAHLRPIGRRMPAPDAPSHALPADIPRLDLRDARYDVRFAATPDDVDAALRLRYEVFNLELGEGLPASAATGRDEDEFDAVCRHLLVVDRPSGRVVGTYRLQTSEVARAGRGFYSATEFWLGGLPAAVLDDAVELGRACVARDHRNTRVLFLLWRGVAAYVAANHKQYLFGCCSLTSRDPGEGARAAAELMGNGHLHPKLRVTPRPELACAARDEELALPPPPIPKLFGMYLRQGAKVCGPPAMDREFGTIDFFVLLDVDAMDRDRHSAVFGGAL